MSYLAETTWCPGGSKMLNGPISHFRHGRDVRLCGKNLASRAVLERPATIKLSTPYCGGAVKEANANFRWNGLEKVQKGGNFDR